MLRPNDLDVREERPALAVALELRQVDLGENDGAMAKRLGIPRTTYSSIKTGKNRVSLRVAKRIVAVFPDLMPFVFMDEPDPS